MRLERENQVVRTEPEKSGSGPIFYGPLRWERLKSFPNGVFLLSNVSQNPPNSDLEAEITEETSRKDLWKRIVKLGLNGRTFSVFPDRESLEAEKDERLKVTPVRAVKQ